jgi:hypothetical protein
MSSMNIHALSLHSFGQLPAGVAPLVARAARPFWSIPESRVDLDYDEVVITSQSRNRSLTLRAALLNELEEWLAAAGEALFLPTHFSYGLPAGEIASLPSVSPRSHPGCARGRHQTRGISDLAVGRLMQPQMAGQILRQADLMARKLLGPPRASERVQDLEYL